LTSAGARPQTPLGSLQRSPNPYISGFKGPTSKGRGGEEEEGEKEGRRGDGALDLSASSF